MWGSSTASRVGPVAEATSASQGLDLANSKKYSNIDRKGKVKVKSSVHVRLTLNKQCLFFQIFSQPVSRFLVLINISWKLEKSN